MITSSVLKKDKALTVPDKQSIEEVIQSASRVIAPLWPIETFAARNPWVGFEKQSFEEVANFLKATKEVDIYPGAPMIRAAYQKGEIDEAFLQQTLDKWLRNHSFKVPLEQAYRYCQTALTFDKSPHTLSAAELEQAVSAYKGPVAMIAENDFVHPLSTAVKNQQGEHLNNILDQHMIKWCKLFLDESQAGWAMPHREAGFYAAWLQLAPYDPALPKQQRRILKEWPSNPDEAIEQALTGMGIPETDWTPYLEGHLLSLPGWAGMMLWRSNQSVKERTLLKEYAAVRLSMEWILLQSFLPVEIKNEKSFQLKELIASWIQGGNLTFEKWSGLTAEQQQEYIRFANSFNDQIQRKIWLEAWERTHEDRLRQQLTSQKAGPAAANKVSVQLAFCIDVRSEPFRRQLEKAGPFETIGIAGFFGLPIATSGLGSHHSHASLPVILKPQHHIKEQADQEQLIPYQERKQAVHSMGNTFKTMKQSVVPSLLLPELSSPWLSLQMAARSFIPAGADRFFRQLHQRWLRKPETGLVLDYQEQREPHLSLGFTDEEKVNYAEQALRMMGLTKDFAPLVVICGHGSRSTNNPYAAALDCGACGGAAGGFNAKVLAALCNLPEVRERLLTADIHIPKETVFAAAEHKTTVDELHWIYVPELSEAAKKAFDLIEEAMPKVSHQANTERLTRLPSIDSNAKNPALEVNRYASDWSENRPEWGLAGNAAFIIGQRELTKSHNLDGRAFLHNYDWTRDQDGSLLANIIAGPGTVTQWINLQYYASTVAPHYYGSGNKTTQTVTAGLGVMQGNASDLMSGLPWQSVMSSDEEAYHSPLRLLIVIQAPEDYIERLLNADRSLQNKIKNGWLRLASIDPVGHWKNWS